MSPLCRLRPFRRFPRHRHLSTEALEDRRMLATFTVTNLGDNGTGSLRAAILAANSNDEPDTILFDSLLNGGVELTSGILKIESPITIQGPHADSMAVDGANNGNDGIFDVRSSGDLTIDRLTLRNGSYFSGGAIDVSSGSATIMDSKLIGNSASGSGGAINALGSVTIIRSELSGNSAGTAGGAIHSIQSYLTISSSVIVDNVAGNRGGGINANEIVGSTTLDTTTIVNTTISGNDAGDEGGGIAAGLDANFILEHTTITGNSSGGDGGGVNVAATASATLSNSIVSGNSATAAGDDIHQAGTVNLHYSLLGTNEDTFFSEASPDMNGNIVGGPVGGSIDAKLSGPAPNGGVLPHFTPLTGSPVIDAGDPAFAAPPDVDARGVSFARVANGRTDMGAIETQPRTLIVESLGGFGPGDLTLIEAINLANNNGGHDTILFDPSLDGLTGGLNNLEVTVISDSVDILGPEHDPITIGTGGSVRDLLIDNGESSRIDVTLAGVNFIDNVPDGPVGSHDGAFIFNRENLMLRSSEIRGGETTGNGGAIYHESGSLRLENVTLSGNHAGGVGGAISSTSSLEIDNSRISGNTSDAAGGAIHHEGGSAFLSVADSVFSENSAYGDGGGMHVRDSHVALARTRIENNRAIGSGADGAAFFGDSVQFNMFDSSVTGNSADDDAAIYFTGGAATFTNTTVSGNAAHDDGAGILAVQSSTVDVQHSTIANNTADVNGVGVGAIGGLFAASGSTITADHSIIAGNVDRFGLSDVGADIGSSASLTVTFSLIGTNRSTINDSGGNIVGSTEAPIDPGLGSLVLGQSGTRFHGLVSSSPAIDAGNPNVSGAPFSDQRLSPFLRIVGAAIDMGSIESQPQTLIVDTEMDEFDGDFSAGDLSLREALSLVGGAELDTIQFSPAINGRPMLLTMGELPVTGSVRILGSIIQPQSIQAQSNSRIFNIDDGDNSQASDVTLRGLTLTGGDTQFVFLSDPDEDGYGGAIRSYENLTITDSMISDNEADLAGGGLFAGGIGSVTIERSEISNNSTTQEVPSTQGGGAAFRTTGSVTIRDSTVESNQTRLSNPNGVGGGLYIDASDNLVQIERSSIVNNASGGSGGGLFAQGSGFGHVLVNRSTISGNATAGPFSSGGGVLAAMNDNSLMQLFNSTISSNDAERYGGGLLAGFASEVHLFGSTVANNYSYGSGGGLFLSTSANVVINSSIVADNQFVNGTGPDIRQSGGSTIDAVFSLIGDAFGTNLSPGLPDSNGNLIGHSQGSTIDAQLGPLTDNGGTTLTHRPLETSPVIDSGNLISPGLGTQDQIGNNRIVNGRLDMGSVEIVNSPTIDPDFNNDGQIDGLDIDLLQGNIVDGPADPAVFDLTGDGLVDLADRDEWLALAGDANLPSGNAYLLGDANLDGNVDGADFLQWNDHKFTANSAWTAGDFNADGAVDGVDFLVWNDNKFQSADTLKASRRDSTPDDERSLGTSERDWFDTIFASWGKSA